MQQPPPPAPVLSSRVELFFSAAAVAQRDVLSKSDPYAVVYVGHPRPAASGVAYTWAEVGRTETIMDNQSPSWATQVQCDFLFEELQPLRVVVFDYDGPGVQGDALGSAEVPLGRLMAARGRTLTLPLVGPGSVAGATLTIRGSEVAGNNDELRFAMRCVGLDKKDKVLGGLFGGSSDPYVVLSRVLADGAKQRVWTSAVIKKNLNPVWGDMSLRVQVLCNGDPNLPLEVEVFDWDSDGSHDFIGAFTSTLNQLLAGAAAKTAWPLVNPRKAAKKKGYVNSGTFALDRAGIVRVPSLLDYIAGGLQINMALAVDYTGSNGDPRDPRSLHFMSPAGNEYLAALTSCGSILLVRGGEARRSHSRAPTAAPRAVDYHPQPLFPLFCRSTTLTSWCPFTALVAPSPARRATALRSRSMTRRPRCPASRAWWERTRTRFRCVRWPQQTRGIRVGCAQAREAIVRTATTGPVRS